MGTRLVTLGMFILPTRQEDYSYPCMWTISNWQEKTENIEPTWKILMEDVDLGEPTSFLDHEKFGLYSKSVSNHQGYCGELQRLPTVCSQIDRKCLSLARIGRPDILWSVNKLARAETKWTKTCDKCLARLISYIHHTCEFIQYCHVGNTAKQCSLGLFQDSYFAGDLGDSKSTSVGILCIFGSHTFVPMSWMCKKQTFVSHSSTEAEVISLDASLRMDGIPLSLSGIW